MVGQIVGAIALSDEWVCGNGVFHSETSGDLVSEYQGNLVWGHGVWGMLGQSVGGWRTPKWHHH